jgi:hypothetical protein
MQELAGIFAFQVWVARRGPAALTFSQATQAPKENCAFEHSPE